jgi:16S rRNA (cytidine1402-2'-O)-methyltransferase
MSDDASVSTPDSALPAGLVLVSVPIGNLGDITPRALAALAAADLVLCEDSRVTRRLFAALGIGARLQPLHDHNEAREVEGLLGRLAAGQRLALVSDAGTPLLSDPGYRLVRAAIAAGHHVTAVPGANAGLMALTLSGLPPHPYLFLGFLPPRGAARRAAFADVRRWEGAGLAATLIWHEAPHRLAEALADAAAVLGAREAAVARELTKHFEEVRRGTLGELAAHYAQNEARGEITLVVAGAAAEAAPEADIDALLREAMAATTLKEAVARVAAATGRPRREVYALALAIR